MARGFFVDVEHEGVGKIPYPGAAYRFSSFGEVQRAPAPRLGADTEAVLAALEAAHLAKESV
jgi:crotonobetainyl-CoA:carnitine CoA-transferase CaiB-like acyl-CoA transferase